MREGSGLAQWILVLAYKTRLGLIGEEFAELMVDLHKGPPLGPQLRAQVRLAPGVSGQSDGAVAFGFSLPVMFGDGGDTDKEEAVSK